MAEIQGRGFEVDTLLHLDEDALLTRALAPFGPYCACFLGITTSDCPVYALGFAGDAVHISAHDQSVRMRLSLAFLFSTEPA